MVVTAPRPMPVGGAGGGGGGGGSGEQPTDTAIIDDGPARQPVCPNAGEPTPTSGDINDIRREAREFAAEVNRLNALTTIDNEFTAIVFIGPDGEVATSQMTGGGPGTVQPQIPSQVLPSGSTILAVIHSHPGGSVTPSPSGQGGNDWAVYDYYATYNRNGIAADPNLLQYIVTPQGVFEYTSSDRETEDPSEGNNVTTGGGCG